MHCNLVRNDYQHSSKVLFTFVPNKQFGQLINISPHSLTMMKTVNTEFSSVQVWFKDQFSKASEISKAKSKDKGDERQEIYIPPEKRQQIIDDLNCFNII